MIDSSSLAVEYLREIGLHEFAKALSESSRTILCPSGHGHFDDWKQLLEELPASSERRFEMSEAHVTVPGSCSDSERQRTKDLLMKLHPWRKGPFRLLGIEVDAEWRSDLKWNRVVNHIDWKDKSVLDVGCGNGYYGWRMLGAGAKQVLGLEPYPLYNAQFAAISKFAASEPNWVVAANDECLRFCRDHFDIVVSMGVFYHSKDPLGHLLRLKQTLKHGGQMLLETLVVDGDVQTVLLPQDRYAKMRNVWFLPSQEMLVRMASRIGFREVSVVDVTTTTPQEQRRTDWMQFESLQDFLDPENSSKTVEGSPAPQRAVLIASR